MPPHNGKQRSEVPGICAAIVNLSLIGDIAEIKRTRIVLFVQTCSPKKPATTTITTTTPMM